MDTGRRGQRACGEPTKPLRLEALAQALGAAASRRRVLGAALAALLVPRLPVAGAAATQEETCPGGACPCPCSDPPCFVPASLQEQGGGQFNGPTGVAVAPDGETVYVSDAQAGRIQAFCVVPSAAGEPARATPVAGSPVVSGAATPVTAGSG